MKSSSVPRFTTDPVRHDEADLVVKWRTQKILSGKFGVVANGYLERAPQHDKHATRPRNKTTQQDHEGVRMGAIDDIKGRAKKALGDLTDNNKLKQEGKADRATGKVKDAADAVSDKVKDAADALRKKTD